MPEITLSLSQKQRMILNSDKEINIVSAGRGSGKTAITAIIAILHLLEGRNVLIVTATYKQAKRDNWEALQKFLNYLKIPAILNNSDFIIKYGKNKIIVSSGGQGEQELSKKTGVTETVRGATSIATLIFDEAASLPHKIFLLSIATMRDLGGAKRRIYIVGTPPDNAMHWVAKMAESKDVFLINANGRDNPFIEPDYLDMLEKEYELLPDDFRRRELYGEMIFTDVSNMGVFNGFQILPNYIDFIDEPEVVGLDISGRGSDKTVFTRVKGRQIKDMVITSTPYDNDIKKLVDAEYLKSRFDVLRYDSTGFGHLLTFDLPSNVIVQPVEFSGAGGERFANARALIYATTAKLKTLYMPQNIINSYGQQVLGEMKATSYKIDDKRKLSLIPKEIIRQKIGRSPDRLDSICLACSYHKPINKEPIQIAGKFFTRKFEKNLL